MESNYQPVGQLWCWLVVVWFQKIKVFHSLKSTDRFKIINKFFYTRKTLNRPFITLKIAISKNGFSKSPTLKNITSDKTQYFMHSLRLSHDAIAVGMNTVLDDKPKLTCRLQGVSKNIVKLSFSNKEIINGQDITTEAAITKLMFLLAKNLSDLEIKKQLQQNLRGEFSH